jgi:hypothetical protein
LDLRTRGRFAAGCGHGHTCHGGAGKRGRAYTTQKGSRGGASNTVACGISYPDKDHHGWTNFPANTVTLRSGPSNGCMQTGQGLHDQRADYLCYTPGDGGTWTFVRNTSTGAQGWVRDDQLPHYGSDVVCEDNPPPATVRG